MNLRVLHVLDHSVPLHSGYTFRTLSILKEQRAIGWETFHLTSTKHAGPDVSEEIVDGMRFYRTPKRDDALRKAPVIGQYFVIQDTAQRLRQVVDIVKPDILHAHSPCLNGIAALQVGTAKGLPVVYEVRAFWEDAAVDHGTTSEDSVRYKLTRAMETWALKRAHRVTTICEGLRADILSRGVPAEKVTVIPNAVNPSEFKFSEAPDLALRHQLGLDDTVVLGFLGSFYGYEGLDTLLAAMPEILQHEPRTRVLLVGGGFEDERLHAQAKALGIADKIIFTGRVPHREVGRYYSLVDLLVYPRKSMRLTETVTPLKPLEAMAQGKLLVASDVGGHRELIQDGVTGYLFEPDDPQALAAAVRRVFAERNRWDEVRRAGRAYVETERNWQVSVARYEQVYRNAMLAAGRS